MINEKRINEIVLASLRRGLARAQGARALVDSLPKCEDCGRPAGWVWTADVVSFNCKAHGPDRESESQRQFWEKVFDEEAACAVLDNQDPDESSDLEVCE